MKYSIVIVTFDTRYEKYFKPLIKEIKLQKPNIEILVEVNGNYKVGQKEDFKKDALINMSEYNNVYPQFYTKFTSLSKLWNSGIQNSSNDIVLVLNDDITINGGFFDWLDAKVTLVKDGYFLINNLWSHFLIDRNFLNSINWFDERFLGVGWEDLDIDRHKRAKISFSTPDDLIYSYNREFASVPAQEKIIPSLGKYTKFNEDIYNRKHVEKNLSEEADQYPYYLFEVENYDSLGKTEISYGSLGYNNTSIRNTSEEELEYQSNEVESYFKYCDVNEGDVVVDLGACIGLVTLRMLEKNPSKVYSVEAADLIYQDLCKNVESYDNVVSCKKLIGTEKNKVGIFSYSDKDDEVDILSFYEFVKQNKIDKIDFMKMDIEGAEFEIFNDDESSNWIKDNVKNIVGEIHLRGNDDGDDNREEFPHLIDKIKELGFDLILNSLDGQDITEQLINNFWLTDTDQNAIDYYTEVLFYASKKVVVNNLIEEPMVMEAV